MLTFPLGRNVLICVAASICAVVGNSAIAADTKILFDVPDTIECTDATPEKFRANHPNLKVIEAKLRISARVLEGTESDIVDFLYMITSPGLHMKIQDYLPNTTLESTVQGDQMEIADTSESTGTTTEDCHVGYKILSLGGTANQGNKKTESSKYKEIAPKALVVASGTTNREHGVFFKLEPVRDVSLEGAKTFTFLAIVPKGWRGDWCVVSCVARAKKRFFFSVTTAEAGVAQAHVGMYLSGDREANLTADQLCEFQEVNQKLLATPSPQNGLVEAMHAATSADHLFGDGWLQHIFTGEPKSDDLGQQSDNPQDVTNIEQRKVEVQKEMFDVEDALRQLSGSDI
ncbi:MAG TPA: hypothetical protein VGN12_30280 [Pirellulales bacterium]|jgi:hypothetical protein